jgi:alanine-glyoxylate transaminase/serine-glyoxylate transaminase/serine-pyruvate transaminase
LEMVALDPRECSNALTALFMPEGFDEKAFRAVVLDKFNMSLGSGLGKLAGRAFRIGHLGDFNELMLAGTLAGVEMGFQVAGIPHRRGGAGAALKYIAEQIA